MNIAPLFYPRAVAVIGSTAEGKLAYELLRQVVEGGFEHAFAVNPKAQAAFGVEGYVSVCDVPEAVDLAVIASPAATVAGVLEDCGRAGVSAAVVITSGFGEAGNAAGEAEIKQVAERCGIILVGPNCAGIANTHHRLFATLETRPPAGRVAFISQSGAMGGAVLSWAEEQGIGISKFLSYGNRAGLDEIQLLPYLAEDDETKVVALYIESVRDGRAFLAAASEFTRRKPLVVIKAGRSTAGQRATLSHTGSLAGSDAVYDAALRSAGAIRVANVEEMFDLCKAFAALPPVRGRRIAIVTNSGGPGVLAADRAEEVGLVPAEPSPALSGRLAGFLPPHCGLRNPLDLTVEGTEAGYRRALEAALNEYDMALALDVSTPYLDSVALARGVCGAARSTGKPVAANFMAGRTVSDAVAYLNAHGVPNFPTGERAVAALARMTQYYDRQKEGRRKEEFVVLPSSFPLPPGPAVTEPDALSWLGANGLPVPSYRVAGSEDEAARAAGELGYPVAMKVVAPDIVHKSDCGGVVLNVSDEHGARAAYGAIREAAAGHDFQGVLVTPMVRGGQEVLLGLSRDPQFGPVVACGAGGIYAEVWRDIALRVAPVDRREALSMLAELRSFPILRGLRGQPPCHIDALAEAVVRVSELPFRYPEIMELDLNPVFALPDRVVIGDVRVILETAAPTEDRSLSQTLMKF